MLSKNKRKSVIVGLITAFLCLLLLVASGTIFFFIQQQAGKATGSNRQTVTPTATMTKIARSPTIPLVNRPLFFDNFADKSKGWSLGSAPGYKRMIDNSTLRLANSSHKILTESLPTETIFTDFIVTVAFTIVKADKDDSVGLYVRGDSNLDHDYRIDIYGNNTYAISKELLNANKTPLVNTLVNPSSTSVLHPVGQQNILTVMMKGPLLVLLINTRVTSSVTDTDYTAGQIALFVQNSPTSSGVEASFKSIVVYPAPKQLPTAN
ncbi:MAG: hypothetical protein E6I91_06055 [Chloroflexi bacterium]|nr:MAG: hypothetical protein E6I91_06055 [Chloroflexota bacterium]